MRDSTISTLSLYIGNSKLSHSFYLGKFYLGDAGFGLTSQVLTPYGRTRYHLKEFSNQSPKTAEELFNLRHAALRNAIERAFGILKRRFPIIASGSECMYSCETMTNIVLACSVLHNFLLSEGELSALDTPTDDGCNHSGHVACSLPRENRSGIEYMRGREIRDRIASVMWEEYCRRSSQCDV